MPKEKAAPGARCRRWVAEFGDVFSTDGSILFCKACETSVASDKRCHVVQHIATQKHVSSVNRKKVAAPQLLADAFSGLSKVNEFSRDLCAAFLSADIPLWKLTNSDLRCFLEKYTKERVPDESTLRKRYVKKCYEETLAKIRTEIGDNYVWVSVDETTDASGRYVANFVVGSLKPDEASRPILLNTEALDKVNHSTIARFFTASLELLWPGDIQYDKVLLFVTDGASYMCKAGKGLKVLYSKMIHVTCVVHAMHRVAEVIRHSLPEVDSLVSNTKKVFLKAPSRIAAFRELAPGVPLPPQPVLTRWGTWLSAAMYYSEHFRTVKAVLEKLPDDAISVTAAREMFSNAQVEMDLAYINANFNSLTTTMKKLETIGLPLTEAIKALQHQRTTLQGLEGKGSTAAAKLELLIAKNQGLSTMFQIGMILKGEGAMLADEELSPQEISCFKFAPVSSCDVERSFSTYKALLRANRQSFKFENLKMSFIVSCYCRNN